MIDRKIFDLLNMLNSSELRNFDEFLRSPYFNKHERVLALWQYIKPFVGLHLMQELLPEDIFAAIAPDLSYNQKQFNHWVSYLTDLLTQFLGQEYLAKYPEQLNFFSLRRLAQNELSEKHFRQLIRQQQRFLEEHPYKDATYYRQYFELHEELDAHFLGKPQRSEDPNLQLKSNFLDLFYCYSKLKIACDMTSRNIVINADYRCHLLPEILQVLELQPHYLEEPGIALYYYILLMLQSGGPEDYRQVKLNLEKSGSFFRDEELLLMYDYAQNHCIRRINSGDATYYAEFLSLFKLQLDKGILFRNGYLEEWDYKNIVTAGVRTGEFEWTEQFIEENKKYLKPDLGENAYIYNLSNLYYETQRYREALRLLHRVEFTDPSYHLGAKNIQLKSYYELGELTAFDALIRAFREYVRRNKQLSEYRQAANLNFLSIAQKLGQIKEQFSYRNAEYLQKALQKAGAQLQGLSPIANSDWLQKVYQEISGKLNRA